MQRKRELLPRLRVDHIAVLIEGKREGRLKDLTIKLPRADTMIALIDCHRVTIDDHLADDRERLTTTRA